VEGEGLLIKLVGELAVSALEGEITEADAGEGSEFAIWLGGDGLLVEGLRGRGIAGDVGEIGESEEPLGMAGVRAELGDKALEGGLGILGFALIDLELGLTDEGVAGGDGTGIFDEDGVESREVALGRGGREGLGGIEVLLLFQLSGHKDAAEGNGTESDGGKDLGAVTVDRVNNAAGLARGDGTEGVEVLRFLIFGGLLRGFCHGLGWVGKKGPPSLRQRRPEV
jgi:hypothetical protein